MDDSLRQLLAVGLLCSYLIFCAVLWRRQRRLVQTAQHSAETLIVWASQGGNAQQLAQQLHQHLINAQHDAHCLALDQLTPSQLQSTAQCVFIVSTFGDGEAPEHARHFFKKLSTDCTLHTLKIHVLGLGDRSYPLFCHFAEQLQARLLAQGATVSLPLMTVDAMSSQDIQHWHEHITQFFAVPAIESQHYQPAWFNAILIERQHLNSHSSSPGLYKLRFVTAERNWRAGDTLLLHPHNQPDLKPREYSIASSSNSGYLELIVRLSYNALQQPGVCSSWLCHDLALNSEIHFSICAKPNFHAINTTQPAIFIGAGSGLAGLRAHIAERPSGSQNWLILGERCPQTDKLLPDELEHWQHNQHLAHLDYAFSRDPLCPRYAQDYLLEQQQRLQDWLSLGATLYVCGNLQGLGRGVQQTLTAILGEEQMHSLQQQGRYRTDLY
ncbi:MAG TPA: hypothetical protein GX719_08820 [Gammaproteobacteria bacterium]|nr:hypothetical protein [Gammaproteobacteria bacterium]